MTEGHSALDDGGGSLDPASGYVLPIVEMDDGSVPRTQLPEREWPDELLATLSLVAMAGCLVGVVIAALAAVVLLLRGEFVNAGLAALAGVGLLIASQVQGALGWHLGRFSRWGWSAAMAELAAATLVWIHLLLAYPLFRPAALIPIAVCLQWMRHFWKRRGDFRFAPYARGDEDGYNAPTAAGGRG